MNKVQLYSTAFFNNDLSLLLITASAYAHNVTKYFSGELAESFSALVRVLHSGQFKCVSPGDFKRTVGKFKSQFSGFDQQDSQELLAFLMDGLQEDLNKVLLVLDRLKFSSRL